MGGRARADVALYFIRTYIAYAWFQMKVMAMIRSKDTTHAIRICKVVCYCFQGYFGFDSTKGTYVCTYTCPYVGYYFGYEKCLGQNSKNDRRWTFSWTFWGKIGTLFLLFKNQSFVEMMATVSTSDNLYLIQTESNPKQYCPIIGCTAIYIG
jgi:hypothetical protein